jgi:AmpD protein
MENYPKINKDRIVGHSFVAPGRKSDPGIYFDWEYFKSEV